MAKQSLPQATYDDDNIRQYPPQVKGQSVVLQTSFDQGTIDSKKYTNEKLIPALESTTPNDSGANTIGTEGTFGTNNVADEIKAIKVITDNKASSDNVYLKSETYNKTEIDTLDNANVKLTGNQTISNIKTFATLPEIPTAPILGVHPTSKLYVDNAILDIVVGILPDGSVTDDKLSNDPGQAKDNIGTNATDIGTNTTSIGTNATNIATNVTNLDINRIAKDSTGATNNYVVDTDGIFDLAKDGNIVTYIPNFSNTGASDVAFDGQVTKNIKLSNGDGTYIDLVGGEILQGTPVNLIRLVSEDIFVIVNPQGGGGMKVVQRGTVINPTLVNDITISEVDMSKSFVIVQQNIENNGDYAVSDQPCVGFLTSSTNLRIIIKSANTVYRIHWEVPEFN